ncbi:DMSO/TMAO reductase YedYZ, molybdopterin-dependent catalytic subunit [Variovorax sp. OV329]|nr:DMSO/TMAO reductase YedYZ, molybdopterin-dependent catalytic subunit [Variovorax sp. OV329]
MSAVAPLQRAFAQAAPAARPLPAYAAFKDPGSMIVHSTNTIEMRRGAAGMGAVTTVNQLYVRNNLAPPSADIMAKPDEWVVSVEGVRVPRQFTLGELKKRKSETVTMVLQCSGNGRGFFPSKPSGTPWTTGAAGCVMFTGVPVRELVAAQGGLLKGARFMTGTGGEVLPAGIDPKSRVERSVPLEAMEDAILAWQINGEPIPLAHGGPLRLVVPGFTGVNSVKYVKRLAFGSEESDSAIQQTDYRMTPASEKSVRPTDPSVWQMPPKSWVNLPLPDSQVKAGETVAIQGVAFGGVHAVRHVDVSTDGGATWARAELVGPDLGRFAWRQFALNVKLSPGAHLVTSRITDVKGNVQIENRVENRAGYINSSWRDHAVKIQAA